MIIYHPAYDHYHSVFRLIMILRELKTDRIEKEKLRILEFLYLFPKEIGNFRIEQIYQKTKNQFKSYPQYESMMNPIKVYYRLGPYFEATIETLVTRDIIIVNEDELVLKSANFRTIPETFLRTIDSQVNESRALIDFLVSPISEYPLFGTNGLRDRAPWLSARYDKTVES